MPNNGNLVQGFLDQPTNVLKKTLDAQTLRQRAHAQNIANAETPGYQRVAVDFEQQLSEVLSSEGPGTLARTDPRHLPIGSAGMESLQATTHEETPDPESPGINGVNIDTEMAEMAETQLRYLTTLELLKRRYTGLKSAIKGQ